MRTVKITEVKTGDAYYADWSIGRFDSMVFTTENNFQRCRHGSDWFEGGLYSEELGYDLFFAYVRVECVEESAKEEEP